MFTDESSTLITGTQIQTVWISCWYLSSCFRLNEAPVAGFEKDVGSKTTMRITYPEGAIQKPERYEKSSLFVFSAFKPMDFKWLRHMVFRDKLVRHAKIWSLLQYMINKLTNICILFFYLSNVFIKYCDLIWFYLHPYSQYVFLVPFIVPCLNLFHSFFL